jgi:hypothetical protein
MHGFAYVAAPTRLHFADFSDRKKVESEYLEECKTLLKTCMDGVDQIHIYNWLVCIEVGELLIGFRFTHFAHRSGIAIRAPKTGELLILMIH